MSHTPKVECGLDPATGMSRVLVTYYGRLAAAAIDDTVCKAITLGVQTHLLEDPEFRQRVTEAIQAAAANLPLEAITKAVKDAIAGK